MNIVDIILSRQQWRIEIGWHRAGEQRHVGSQIGQRIDFETYDFATAVKPHLGRGNMIATMRISEERLTAVRGPFDRAIGLHRRPKACDLFGIDIDFRPKTTPDIRRDNP